MEVRIELLRRRIATHRRHIAENPDIESVRVHLAAMVADQRELDALEQAQKAAKSTE
jgi:hypothetical protein